ncbi:MAG TPA: NADH-quinone oxidoreductase subunit A [Candidatus Baltobacteraceae bacterium]|nr:NADH-quinone oxidoreductase subunit A [Candidatus Baltobacteraceae bacterium]
MGTLWSLPVYFGLVLVVVAGMLGLSFLLGERHREHATDEPYESGIASTGSARMRFSVKFYLVAVFFVVFDLEAVFVFAWSVSLREVGWTGYVEALIFITVLVATLVYLWREGALDWGPARVRRLSNPPVSATAEAHGSPAAVRDLPPAAAEARGRSKRAA